MMATATEPIYRDNEGKLWTPSMLDAELARQNLSTFVRQAWPLMEPARNFVPNWHIDAICEHLQAVSEGKIKRLLITVPPGHAKSLLISVAWPAWIWTQCTDHFSGGPRWRGIFTAYAAELSTRDSMRCRALIQSHWYQSRFLASPNTPWLPSWKLSSDQNVKSWFENTEKGFRMSLGVGTVSTGFRGDAVVVDDPLHAKDQFSDAALNEVIFWWDQVMSSRLNDMSTGQFVIIMQRLSERDLAAHVLARGGYEHLNLPSEFEPERRAMTSIGWHDPREEAGELLFPALFPPDVIAAAKTSLGSTGFAAQHQQRPSPAGGGILQERWWRYWRPRGIELPPVRKRLADGSEIAIDAVELPDSFDEILQSWDMAFKETKTSDFVVGQVQAKRGANRYILDQVRDRLDMPKTVHAVRDLSGRWPHATAKLVEDKANGPAVVQTLREEIVGLIEVNPEGGKISRAAAAAPELEAGNWYLPHPAIAAWVDGFVAECASFPNGANDDQVDSWSQGANRMRKASSYRVPEDAYYDDLTRPVGLLSRGGHKTRWLTLYVDGLNTAAVLDIYDDNTHLWVEQESVRSLPTNAEHAEAIKAMLGGADVRTWPGVIVPETAASLRTELISRRMFIATASKEKAEEIPDSIRRVSSLLAAKKIKVHRRCINLIRDLHSYSPDQKTPAPACEALRQYVAEKMPSWRVTG